MSDPTPVSKASAPKKHILVIDDDAGLVPFLSSIFKKAGGRFLAAHSGEIGIEVFKANRETIELIILDYNMREGMDGEEAYHHLRKVDGQIPIIMLSGFAIDPSERLMSQGLLAYLRKPLNVGVLQSLLYKHAPNSFDAEPTAIKVVDGRVVPTGDSSTNA